MGGRNGLTLTEYAAHSDRQIVALLGIEWDEDGGLVTEAEQQRQRQPGSIARAQRELPSPEKVGLTPEVLEEAQRAIPRASLQYLVMFFSVLRKRGLSAEETMERWKRHHAETAAQVA